MGRIRESVERLAAYQPGEQPKVEGLIKLNTNENPYPPSPAVAEALRCADAAALRLYPDPMATALRKRLAEIHGTGEQNIFVGNGSDEVLRLAVRAFTQTGGSAAMFEPTYSLYPVLCAAEEVDVERTPLGEGFSWREPVVSERAGLFFLTNPNAPTGVKYDDADVEGWVKRFPGVVLIDEAYGDFADGTPGTRLAETYDNVLVCRTLSKSFSLAGIRCGYAIGDARLVGALCKLKDSYNLDALTQRMALAALGDLDWMRANARKIRATRERVRGELERMGYDVIPSSANFLFVRPTGTEGAAELFRRLRENRILVRHFPNAESTKDWLRISVGTDEQMDRLLAVARPG